MAEIELTEDCVAMALLISENTLEFFIDGSSRRWLAPRAIEIYLFLLTGKRRKTSGKQIEVALLRTQMS